MLTEREEGNAGKPNQTSPVHDTIGMAVNRASSPSGDVCTTKGSLPSVYQRMPTPTWSSPPSDHPSEVVYTNLGLSTLKPVTQFACTGRSQTYRS